MIKFGRVFSPLFIACLCFSFTSAQNSGLPRVGKYESYKSVRTKMLKAGWKPYHSPNADECLAGDKRCDGRPEMKSCAGTGKAPCIFLWKRRGRTVSIITVGENAAFDGYRF